MTLYYVTLLLGKGSFEPVADFLRPPAALNASKATRPPCPSSPWGLFRSSREGCLGYFNLAQYDV